MCVRRTFCRELLGPLPAALCVADLERVALNFVDAPGGPRPVAHLGRTHAFGFLVGSTFMAPTGRDFAGWLAGTGGTRSVRPSWNDLGSDLLHVGPTRRGEFASSHFQLRSFRPPRASRGPQRAEARHTAGDGTAAPDALWRAETSASQDGIAPTAWSRVDVIFEIIDGHRQSPWVAATSRRTRAPTIMSISPTYRPVRPSLHRPFGTTTIIARAGHASSVTWEIPMWACEAGSTK
jgi:hypothetical protein